MAETPKTISSQKAAKLRSQTFGKSIICKDGATGFVIDATTTHFVLHLTRGTNRKCSYKHYFIDEAFKFNNRATSNAAKDILHRLFSEKKRKKASQSKQPTAFVLNGADERAGGPEQSVIPENRVIVAPSHTGKKDDPIPIHVNDFLVRRSPNRHKGDGHSLVPVNAIVSILPKQKGEIQEVKFLALWCPKCQKYFMDDAVYQKLKSKGYICCKVIEEKNLAKHAFGDNQYGGLALESVLHSYGYNVNQQNSLSEHERRTIIDFVVENRIQSIQEISRLLEWLISSHANNSRMRAAVGKWRSDLNYVRHYQKPTRTVRVDRIFAKV